MKMKQFAVLGLGRFGASVATTLVADGQAVLAVDHDEAVVAEMAVHLPRVVQADATDAKVLKALRLHECDVAVVTMGECLEASILATLACRDLGIPQIVAKATSEAHGRALTHVGAHRVVFPEREMGFRVANNLTAANIVDYVRLSPEHSMAELRTPARYQGRTLAELQLAQRYGLNVMAIKRGKQVIVSPRASETLREGDQLVVIGKSTAIRHLEE